MKLQLQRSSSGAIDDGHWLAGFATPVDYLLHFESLRTDNVTCGYLRLEGSDSRTP